MPNPTLEEINAKLDKIIAHQRHATIWGVIHTLFTLTIFIVLVVVPLWFIYDFTQHPFNYIDVSKLLQYAKNAENFLNTLK